MTVFVVALPLRYEQLLSNLYNLNAGFEQLGLSIQFVALYATALDMIVTAGLLGMSIVLLQQIFPAQSQIATVVSTLGIAALFLPLRRRIRRDIDRLFYRRKNNAERTLARFTATIRQEVDLEDLTQSLLAVIEETMQPSTVILW